jgi:hypothetical protein
MPGEEERRRRATRNGGQERVGREPEGDDHRQAVRTPGAIATSFAEIWFSQT